VSANVRMDIVTHTPHTHTYGAMYYIPLFGMTGDN
jgi:hypothetical protein